MNVKRIVVGELDENCYIVENKDNCIIIDPGDEVDKIVNNIDKKVVGILVTHYHFDHIGALDELVNKYKVKVNEVFDGFDYEIIETKGHTDDSKSFYFKSDNIMFCGDFIFKNGIGRLDLGGNSDDMVNSLKMIRKYPSDMVLYPGHGDKALLSNELNNIDYYINVL